MWHCPCQTLDQLNLSLVGRFPVRPVAVVEVFAPEPSIEPAPAVVMGGDRAARRIRQLQPAN